MRERESKVIQPSQDANQQKSINTCVGCDPAPHSRRVVVVVQSREVCLYTGTAGAHRFATCILDPNWWPIFDNATVTDYGSSMLPSGAVSVGQHADRLRKVE